MSHLHPESLPLSGRRLAHLLDRWADAHRLDTQQAEAIRQTIRTVPADLGFDWWWRLLDPDNGSVFGGAVRPSPSQLSRLPTEPEPFVTLLPGLTSWSQDDGEYLPYLRLT